MTRLDEDEYEKYKKSYEELKERTISEYKDSEEGEELWTIAQTYKGTVLPENEDNFIGYTKLAEVALHENKNKNNWEEARNRIHDHVLKPLHEPYSMTNYSPLRYCSLASDELINQAIKMDIEDELGLDNQDADSSADADLEGRTFEKASAADEETTDDSQSGTKQPNMDIGKLPRGEDFAHKFARGEWAETVLLETIERQSSIFAFQYGVSRGDALETKDELDKVKEPGVEEMKRPDILVFEADRFESLDKNVQKLIHDYIEADPDGMGELLPNLEREDIPSVATMALEAESSQFKIDERGDNYSSLSAYVKDEDYPRLMAWRDRYEVPIFVCQLFFDIGYIIPFAAYEKYADEARNGPVPVQGFKHDTIPNIWKDGLQAKVEDFPQSEILGEFSEEPSVIRQMSDGVEEVDFDWSRNGQLEAVDSAFFSGGTLMLEQSFTEYV